MLAPQLDRARGFCVSEEVFMPTKPTDLRLENGTVIRHRITGYQGTVDGITEIKDCFTSGGQRLANSSSKYGFQYRILIAGQAMRKIAPLEDLEVLELTSPVRCPNCQSSFQSKPANIGKPGGRCQCGEWICSSCWCCHQNVPDLSRVEATVCSYQRKRLARKAALLKKLKTHKVV